ncbi:MAG: hypothetical protein R3B90_21890 [Planctomycetaceae bacterium]
MNDFNRAFQWGCGIYMGILAAGFAIVAGTWLLCCGGLGAIGIVGSQVTNSPAPQPRTEPREEAPAASSPTDSPVPQIVGPQLIFAPAALDDVSRINDSWKRKDADCHCAPATCVQHVAANGRYVAASVDCANGAVGVWFFSADGRVYGANSVARNHNEMGSAIPLERMTDVGIDHSIVAAIQSQYPDAMREPRADSAAEPTPSAEPVVPAPVEPPAPPMPDAAELEKAESAAASKLRLARKFLKDRQTDTARMAAGLG